VAIAVTEQDSRPRARMLVRAGGGLVPLGGLPALAYILSLLAVPTGVLLIYSFWTPGFFSVLHKFTTVNYEQVFTESLYWHLLLKSLGVGLAVAAIMVCCGFAMAYSMTFRLGRWGPRILVFVTATLLSSYVVRVYAWKTILGTNGILNRALLDMGLISKPLTFLLYGYFAIGLTLVYVYLPLAVLPIYAALQNIDPRVLEASRDMGASPFRTFRRITLPLALPGIRIAFAFAFIFASSDYVTPNLVGGFSGQMVGNVIQDQFGFSGNYPLGAALSFGLLAGFAAVLAGLVLGARATALLRRRMPTLPRRSLDRHAGLVRRVAESIPYSEIATALLLVFLLMPLVTVILFSFNDTPVPGLPFKGFTTHWYTDVLSSGTFHRVLETSLIVAAAAVAGALLVGVPAAFSLARRRFRLRRTLGILVYGPVAVPGVMIGVALLTTFVFTNITLGILPTITAHILLVMPFVVLVTRARVEEMDPRLEEAGRDLGAVRGRVFRTITLPLIAPALIGAAILAAALSLDDLVVTNFTIGSSATIPVWIFSQAREVGLTPSINAVAAVILVVSLSLIGLAALVMRLKRSTRLSQTIAQR
jgi:ABC-type spermidine/putrescine transport system permease subunit II